MISESFRNTNPSLAPTLGGSLWIENVKLKNVSSPTGNIYRLPLILHGGGGGNQKPSRESRQGDTLWCQKKTAQFLGKTQTE